MTATTASANGAPLLRISELDKHFGPVQALYHVDLDLPLGQVTALCGDNGAGKTVLTKCITGIYQADHGQFYWDGEPVSIRGPRDSSRLGIETVYQDLALADNLDIVQNMFLGRERTQTGLLDEAYPWAGANQLLTIAAYRRGWIYKVVNPADRIIHHRRHASRDACPEADAWVIIWRVKT